PAVLVAAVLLGVALVLAPGWPWLLGRATALPLTEGSSVERLTFLRDGLAMAARLPLGAGYRAWAALHLQGASYGYYSAEVHSAPLDLALAFGWAGAVGFLLLLGRFWLGLRHGRQWEPERLVVLAGLGAVGLHALLDWDLSYAIFMVPLWLGFGLLTPADRAGVPGRVPASLTAALAGLALGAVVVLGAGDAATALADRAFAAGRFDRAIPHTTLATAVAPWNDLAYYTRGQALSRLGRHEEAEAAFRKARRWNPYEPWYAVLDARELAALGRWREASAAYRAYEQLWPWNTAAYEEALEAHLDLIFRANLLGDQVQAAELLTNGRAILADLDRQKAKEPPGRPRKPMNIETAIIQRARQELGE
ncbi:MAG TPA: tetratricopeptide repeat protein, partial [Symbiobacteriaceae bacterium]|nr:tetratricopeptide repeat protein [Symbiobacteriaceae bacterium]